MRSALAGLLMLIALATVASAHHSIRTVYDVTHRMMLNGTIAAVEWKEPHVIIHLNVKNDDGTPAEWDVETVASYNLTQHGLSRDFAMPGEMVRMTVCVAKDGSHKAWLHEMVSPAGTAYFNAGGC